MTVTLSDSRLMQLFRHREDRLPILFICLLFALDLVVFSQVDSIGWLAAWTALGLYPKGWICAWNHHHQHLATFEASLLNRLLELVFGLHTGMTSHAWTLHHVLGHHAHYLDQTQDESRWKDLRGHTMGVVRYTFEVAFTAYPRAWAVSRRYRQHRPAFLGGLLTTGALLAAGLVFRPWQTLFVFLIPMVLSMLVTSWATYTHHAGRPADTHFEASTNILNRTYNALTGNLGYHTAHHYRSGVHWSRLPQLHEQIKHRIAPDAYLQPGFPFSWGQPIDTGASSVPSSSSTDSLGPLSRAIAGSELGGL